MSKRISLEVSDDVASMLKEIADEQETTTADMVRRALAILKTAHTQKKLGRQHIGFVDNASKLDAEIVGVLF